MARGRQAGREKGDRCKGYDAITVNGKLRRMYLCGERRQEGI